MPLNTRRSRKDRAKLITVNTTPIPNASVGVTLNPNHGRTIRLAVKLMPKPTAMFAADSTNDPSRVCVIYPPSRFVDDWSLTDFPHLVNARQDLGSPARFALPP